MTIYNYYHLFFKKKITTIFTIYELFTSAWSWDQARRGDSVSGSSAITKAPKRKENFPSVRVGHLGQIFVGQPSTWPMGDGHNTLSWLPIGQPSFEAMIFRESPFTKHRLATNPLFLSLKDNM